MGGLWHVNLSRALKGTVSYLQKPKEDPCRERILACGRDTLAHFLTEYVLAVTIDRKRLTQVKQREVRGVLT